MANLLDELTQGLLKVPDNAGDTGLDYDPLKFIQNASKAGSRLEERQMMTAYKQQQLANAQLTQQMNEEKLKQLQAPGTIDEITATRNVFAGDPIAQLDGMAKQRGFDTYAAAPMIVKKQLYDLGLSIVDDKKDPRARAIYLATTPHPSKSSAAQEEAGMFRKLASDSLVAAATGAVKGVGDLTNLAGVGLEAAGLDGVVSSTLKSLGKGTSNIAETGKRTLQSDASAKFNQSISDAVDKEDVNGVVNALLSNPAGIPQALAEIGGMFLAPAGAVSGAAKLTAGGAKAAGLAPFGARVADALLEAIPRLAKGNIAERVGSRAIAATVGIARNAEVGLASGLSAAGGAASDGLQKATEYLSANGIDPQSEQGKKIIQDSEQSAAGYGLGVGSTLGAILPGAERFGAKLLTSSGRKSLADGVKGSIWNPVSYGKGVVTTGASEAAQEFAESPAGAVGIASATGKPLSNKELYDAASPAQALLGFVYGGGTKVVTNTFGLAASRRNAANGTDATGDVAPPEITPYDKALTEARARVDAHVSSFADTAEGQDLFKKAQSSSKIEQELAIKQIKKSAAQVLGSVPIDESVTPDELAIMREDLEKDIAAKIAATALIKSETMQAEIADKLTNGAKFKIPALDGAELTIEVKKGDYEKIYGTVTNDLLKKPDGTLLSLKEIATDAFAKKVIDAVNVAAFDYATGEAARKAAMTPEQKYSEEVTAAKEIYLPEIANLINANDLGNSSPGQRIDKLSATLEKLNLKAASNGKLSAEERGQQSALVESLSNQMTKDGGEVDDSTLAKMIRTIDQTYTKGGNFSAAELAQVIKMKRDVIARDKAASDASRAAAEAASAASKAKLDQTKDEKSQAAAANELAAINEEVQKQIEQAKKVDGDLSVLDNAQAALDNNDIPSAVAALRKSSAVIAQAEFDARLASTKEQAKNAMELSPPNPDLNATISNNLKKLASLMPFDTKEQMQALNEVSVLAAKLVAKPEVAKPETPPDTTKKQAVKKEAGSAKPGKSSATTESGSGVVGSGKPSDSVPVPAEQSAARPEKPRANPKSDAGSQSGQSVSSDVGNAPTGNVQRITQQLDLALGDGTMERIKDSVEIVESIDQLPPDAKLSQVNQRAQAFYVPGGKIYLVAKNLDPARAVSVLYHEIAHKNLAPALGTLGVTKLRNEIKAWKSASKSSIEYLVYEAASARAIDSGKYNDEIIPYAIEEAMLRQQPISVSGSPVSKFLASVRDFFAKAMQKVFGKKPVLSVADLLVIAQGMASLEINRTAEQKLVFAQAAEPVQEIMYSLREGIETVVEQAMKGSAARTKANPSSVFQESKAQSASVAAKLENVYERAFAPTPFLAKAYEAYFKDKSLLRTWVSAQQEQSAIVDRITQSVQANFVDPLNKLTAKQRDDLNAVMNRAQLAEVNPLRKGYDGLNTRQKEIKQRFDVLPPAAKKAYAAAVSTFVNLREQKIETLDDTFALRNNINPVALKALISAITGGSIDGYLPLSQVGKYAVSVLRPDGTAEFFRKSDDLPSLQALRRSLIAQYPQYRVSNVGEVSNVLSGLDGASQKFIDGFIATIDSVAGNDLAVRDTLIEELLIRHLKTSGRDSSLQRKMVEFGSIDMFRGIALEARKQARLIAQLSQKSQIAEVLAMMEQEVKDGRTNPEVNTLAMSRAINILREHSDGSTRKDTAIGEKVNGLVSVMFMGFSVAAAGINSTQLVQQSLPYLYGLSNRLGKSAGLEPFTVLAQAISRSVRLPKFSSEAKNKEDKELLETMERMNVSSRGEITQTLDIANYGRVGGVQGKIAKAVPVVNFMNEYVERINRRATFIAAYEMAKRGGMHPDMVAREALNAVGQTQYFSEEWSKPLLVKKGGNAIRMAYALKTFSLSTYASMWRDVSALARDKSLSQNEKKEIITRLKGQLFVQAILAGPFALATPISFTMISMLNGLLSAGDLDDDEIRMDNVLNEARVENYVRKTLGDDAAKLLTGGIPKLLGIDLRGNLQQDFFIRGSLWSDRIEDTPYELGKQLLPGLQIASNILKAGGSVADGEMGKAVEALGQRGISSALKAVALMQNDNYLTTKHGRIIAQLSGPEAIAKGLGFNVTTASDANKQISLEYKAGKDYDGALRAVKDEVYVAYNFSQMTGDDSALVVAQNKLDRFNKEYADGNPEIELSFDKELEKAKKKSTKEWDAFTSNTRDFGSKGKNAYMELKRRGRDDAGE